MKRSLVWGGGGFRGPTGRLGGVLCSIIGLEDQKKEGRKEKRKLVEEKNRNEVHTY